MRIKALYHEGTTQIRALIDHPMESGRRTDSRQNEIPARIIQSVVITFGGNTVADITVGTALSRNPYLAVDFEGGMVGKKIALSWKDNLGAGQTQSVEIEPGPSV